MKNTFVETLAPVASLSRAGYITEPKAIAKRLFDYYMLSLYSQTTSYAGGIASLAYALYKGEDRIEVIIDYITETLRVYYSAYFKEVLIEVKEITGKYESRVTIELSLILGDGTNKITLDSAIKVNEGVVDLSNYG